MKAIVKKAETKNDRPFPKLMICTNDCDKGMIILFRKAGEGQIVKPASDWNYLSDMNGWLMDQFEDFEGTVTLSND